MSNIAIIGSTGIVAQEFIKLLEKSNIKINNLKLFSSKKSLNKKIMFRNSLLSNNLFNLKSFEDIDFAIFCTNSDISKKYILNLKKNNFLKFLTCIDLSSAFRLDKKVPLIIPEINIKSLKKDQKIIASPNCTTTIMLMALFKLHEKFKIKKIITSTYQAASGGGKKLLEQLMKDTSTVIKDLEKRPYGLNVFLHESLINKDNYSLEELKMIKETHKILNDSDILINPTCVRVPVIRAHSLSINCEFHKKFTLKKALDILRSTENLKVIEALNINKKDSDLKESIFATPNLASNKGEVFVSRVRKDITNPFALDMWVCSDQLLKGAALNAFQILKHLIKILLNPE